MADLGDSAPPPRPETDAAESEPGAARALPIVQPGRRFLDVPGAPPAQRGDAGMWVVFGFVGFLVGEVLALILVTLAATAAGDGGQLSRLSSMATPPDWYIGVSLVGLWGGFLFGPWLASLTRGTRRLFIDLGVRFRPIDSIGVVIGVGAQYLVALLYAPFLVHLKNFTAPTQKLTGAAHGWGFVVIAILTVVGAPFFEELFFRGLIFRALAKLFTSSEPGPTTRRAVGVVFAVAVDGLVFGLAHGEWEQFAGLAIFGMILATVSYLTGRLGMNMVAHASFNLVAVLAIVHSRGGVVL